jgi:hypothetical protein
MKRSFTHHICPEYRFDFGHSGVRRTVPALPNKEQDFCGQEYFSNYGCIAGAFLQPLSERYADWAELAVAIYMADRFSPRRDPRLKKDLTHRRRKISLRIAVHDLPFWESTDTKTLLREALWILTEDDWQIQFSKRETPLAPCAQDFLLAEPINQPVRVALFSGGLDSFAGVASQLRIPGFSHVFVSGVTHGRMADGQRQQVSDLLRNKNGKNVRHLKIW